MFEINFNFNNCFCFPKKRKDNSREAKEADLHNLDQRDLLMLTNVPRVNLDFKYNEIDGVYLHDYYNRYIAIQAEELKLFEINPDDLLGKHISNLLPTKFLDDYEQLLEEVKTTRKSKQIIFFSNVYRIMDIIPIIFDDKVVGTISIERKRNTLR